MKILGIDPGYAITGYSVIEYEKGNFKLLKAGAILTEADEEFEDRLKKIYLSLNEIIDTFKPKVMAIEELFFNQNTKTAIKVAEARGVILLSAKINGLDIFEYTPLQVKQAVVGYGRADKRQVQLMVKSILKMKGIPKLDDITDSMAIAICHGHASKTNTLLKSQNKLIKEYEKNNINKMNDLKKKLLKEEEENEKKNKNITQNRYKKLKGLNKWNLN